MRSNRCLVLPSDNVIKHARNRVKKNTTVNNTMDDNTESTIPAESQISTPTAAIDLENNPADQSTSTMDDADITSGTNLHNISASDAEDEQSIQQRLSETEENHSAMDSVNDEIPNETLLETDTTELEEAADSVLDTIDSINDSNLNDTVTESTKQTRSDQKTEKISQFPLGRVRDIMKADPDIKIVSGECVFLVAKATEMFLQRLGREIHTITLRNKKKTLQKKDLDAVISENVAFEFLEGALN
ncbi:DNA polymerase epsilon subunit 4-like [Planococcus citri]|uniref:DNA polymerase epsilon subunit 4-like n=1 Tax=Planococcus citri TaxID=170843 RepID=UPI0031F8DEAE